MTLKEQLIEISPQILFDEPMKNHTTFRIGGNADMFVSVENVDELKRLVKLAKSEKIPFTVIGNGSNLLVRDNGIRGLVIEIGPGLSECVIDGTEIVAYAGIKLSKLANEAARASLTGLEEISGIPGTLGGAIYMNAGAYGGEISKVIKRVDYIDDNGESGFLEGADCDFGYRKSAFSGGGKYIVSAVLGLDYGDKDLINEKMADYTKRRQTKQPLSYPSAGSTFKRPEGHFAGQLIEEAGLKGFRVGDAMISELHAGFVINKGGATATDILTLIKDVQSIVKEKFGVMLETEVKIIGE